MTHTLLIFALVAFVAIATPGPTVLLALTNGSRHGVRASLPGMFGAVLSDFVLIAAVGLGMGALLMASELWFSVVKWLGVVYLAYVGIRMLRSQGNLVLTADAEAPIRRAGRVVFFRSFFVAVTNPKGYLFVSAFLPQFIDPTAPQVPQYLALSMTFALIDFSVMLAYACAGARAIRYLRSSSAVWLDRVCGGAILALAGSLALYRRQA
jgi:threonine/homoserine/homoserine lactone efflux protein